MEEFKSLIGLSDISSIEEKKIDEAIKKFEENQRKLEKLAKLNSLLETKIQLVILSII